MKRTVFFISDSTGITAEVVGDSLLAHFPDFDFQRKVLPYIDSTEKAAEIVTRINAYAGQDGVEPIIFASLVDENLCRVIRSANGFFVDVLNTFMKPLETALGCEGNHQIGRATTATADSDYSERMEAVHFALENDDGGRTRKYDQADIILIGVSRSGKTPTSLYLAMQFGIFCANYPITEDDIEDRKLPADLRLYQNKLYGLTIDPERLASIRQERLSNSRYASPQQCALEVREAEQLYSRFGVPYINTTNVSVEEISTRILSETGLRRQLR